MENKAMDPVTLEVIWNRFLSVANEQQDALIRTAFSTIVRESQDLACGMFDTTRANDRAIAQRHARAYQRHGDVDEAFSRGVSAGQTCHRATC